LDRNIERLIVEETFRVVRVLISEKEFSMKALREYKETLSNLSLDARSINISLETKYL